jgi:hypothetical protein
LVAGAVVLVCVAILSADQVISDRRALADDKLVKGLQKQVQSDAAVAARLAAEKKRITDAKLVRRTRDEVVSWVLIAASAAFLICAVDTTPAILRRRPKRPG